MKLAVIALGGAAGAVVRYLLGGWINVKFGTSFPYGTFIINVSGSFLLGLLITMGTEKCVVPPNLRILLAVGFLGAYTTFSTFTYETIALVANGSLLRAGINIIGSVVAGLIACWIGIIIGKTV